MRLTPLNPYWQVEIINNIAATVTARSRVMCAHNDPKLVIWSHGYRSPRERVYLSHYNTDGRCSLSTRRETDGQRRRGRVRRSSATGHTRHRHNYVPVHMYSVRVGSVLQMESSRPDRLIILSILCVITFCSWRIRSKPFGRTGVRRYTRFTYIHVRKSVF